MCTYRRKLERWCTVMVPSVLLVILFASWSPATRGQGAASEAGYEAVPGQSWLRLRETQDEYVRSVAPQVPEESRELDLQLRGQHLQHDALQLRQSQTLNESAQRQRIPTVPGVITPAIPDTRLQFERQDQAEQLQFRLQRHTWPHRR